VSKNLPLVVDGVYITKPNDPLTGLLLDRGLGGHFEDYDLSIYPDFVTPPCPPTLFFSPLSDRGGRPKETLCCISSTTLRGDQPWTGHIQPKHTAIVESQIHLGKNV
jgi:hypothetical protein